MILNRGNLKNQLPDPLFVDMVCSAPYSQRGFDDKRVYHQHPYFKDNDTGVDDYDVDPDKHVECLHCNTDIKRQDAFRVPVEDREKGDISWCGYYCDPSCGKQWCIEHPNYNSPFQITLISQVAREMYGINGPIRPAQPRIRLKRYGGDLDNETFQKMKQIPVKTVIYRPPFVTWSMVFEERYPTLGGDVDANIDTEMTAIGEVENENAMDIDTTTEEKEKEKEKVGNSRRQYQHQHQSQQPKLTGLRVPDSENVASSATDTTNADYGFYQPSPALFDSFMENKEVSIESAIPTTKGSTMKASSSTKRKRAKEHTKKAKETKTSTASTVPEPMPDADSKQPGNRGSLRAFMKRKITTNTELKRNG